MPSNLLTAIVNDRTRSVNFFNGRLLTGEDLTAEQKANRVAHSLLGQAVGSGVAYGLEVSESATLSTVASPVLSIKQGLAINPNGGTLLLDNDTDISLVRPASPTNGGTSVFQECLPMQSGVYIAGAGVYLLTIGPASANQGLAEVSGVNTGAAPCNSKYKIDGVQFQLIQIDLTLAESGDVNHIRNLVAYKCFGVTDWAANVTDPFGTPPGGHGLIDQLRTAQTITGCEVPLAVLYWTATGGLVFIDMWAVRRPLVSRDLLDSWAPGAGRRRATEGLAMFLQFQAQLQDLLGPSGSGPAIHANQFFRYLPPVGILPISGVGTSKGINYLSFFAGDTFRKPQFVEGARLNNLVREAFEYPPVDLNDKVMVWLYWVRENMQAINTGASAVPNAYVIFASGHVRNYGFPHFDVNRWSYSTYA
ncbi:MAG TPA: hypothetical protein VHA33_06905 [Candidatus Angelobacter sp.]|jgi:hypothetical protein|nr:hypothetical protein [Candidatus Angelobacter sp.]